MTRWKDRFDTIQNVCEWLLIGFMLLAVVILLVSIPHAAAAAAPNGPLSSAFGVQMASIIYAVVWTFEAVLLAWAKFTKRQRVRKWTLFAIYLTHQFTFFLAWSIRGFGWNLLDNFIICGLSAWLWLRAKLYYDYVDYEDLETFDE